MMKYVLIAWISSTAHPEHTQVVLHDFVSESACQSAKTIITNNARRFQKDIYNVECIIDGDLPESKETIQKRIDAVTK